MHADVVGFCECVWDEAFWERDADAWGVGAGLRECAVVEAFAAPESETGVDFECKAGAEENIDICRGCGWNGRPGSWNTEVAIVPC